MSLAPLSVPRYRGVTDHRGSLCVLYIYIPFFLQDEINRLQQDIIHYKNKTKFLEEKVCCYRLYVFYLKPACVNKKSCNNLSIVKVILFDSR